MTFDRSTKTPSGRPSATANPSRWSARSEQKPASGKPLTPTAQPIPRREGQISGNSAIAVDNNGDGATPVKAFLSSNITPRSGSRKARVESASSTPRMTPESTPPIARPASMIEGRDWTSGGPKAARGLGTKGGISRPTRAQSVASDVSHPTGLASADRRERESKTGSPDSLPRFFHANEAKPSHNRRPQSQSPRLQPRLAGLNDTNSVSNVNTYTMSPSPESGDERPKFFHADGSHPANSPTPRLVNGAFSARPPLQTIFSSYQTMNSPVQRPPSPLKEELLPISRKSSLSKPSPRRHTRLISRGSSDIRAPDALVNGLSNLSRRSSLHDSTKRNSQPQSPTSARFEYSSSRRSSIALSDSGKKPAPVTLPEPTHPEASPNEPSITTSPEPHPIESPSKPAPDQSKLDHLNELAANARRERKVLDLEISNSSLLAINRTIEAEMRKQKAELRQLRRLRSSGRFPSSTRSRSSRFSMPSTSDDLSPTSSADGDGMDDDRFSNLSSGTSDDTSFPDSLSFSPTLRNSSIPVAKGHQRRTHRLDLSAQRTLLLDSQKLNQALKRCLGRTDELIADGKKALNYKVNTNELATLGPRVLAPGDQDEEAELGRGLLSPGLEEKLENPWERTRKVGDNHSVPQPETSEALEGLLLDIPEYDDLAQEGDERHRHDEQGTPETSPHLDVGALPGDLRIHLRKETPAADNDNADAPENFLPGRPSQADEAEISYEDPGIDTGSETSPLENKEPRAESAPEVRSASQGDIHRRGTSEKSPTDTVDGVTESATDPSRAELSSSEGTESEEPSVNSPGKSLGNFLRMVGGSWGV
ncbi:MAG: hypothetical protein LQ343_001330 [Gyalolechia ehrenbergii]|nr:MAG: hypothetical protein LQ343_001330 [Gyalolechia ehrenbergii]